MVVTINEQDWVLDYQMIVLRNGSTLLFLYDVTVKRLQHHHSRFTRDCRLSLILLENKSASKFFKHFKSSMLTALCCYTKNNLTSPFVLPGMSQILAEVETKLQSRVINSQF